MPASSTAAPTNASHSVWVSGASARIGRPNAASMGHHDPPGTWIGPGGAAGGSRIGSWCSVFQRGSRFATVGITEKLYGGGGEGIAHSSVAPPHGSFGAGAPCERVRHRLTTNTSVATPIKNAPIVETRLRLETPGSGAYV